MYKRSHLLVSIILATGALGAIAGDDPPAAEKSAFSFLNPTPTDLLRPMTIDGPGTTESPYTVDAGHFQIEMVLFGYSSYAEAAAEETYRLDEWSIGPMMLKLGLFNQLDVQLVLEPYNHVFEREGDYWRETSSGFGDTTLRLKYNLWGNDSGRSALALIPFVRFPTGAEGLTGEEVQGGLLLPFCLELPREFYLSLTSGFASEENLFSNGRQAEFRNSAALSREMFSALEGYVEFFSAVSTERDSPWVGAFGSGLSYWFTDDLLVNAGFSLGLTSGADDWHAYVGMAWRY